MFRYYHVYLDKMPNIPKVFFAPRKATLLAFDIVRKPCNFILQLFLMLHISAKKQGPVKSRKNVSFYSWYIILDAKLSSVRNNLKGPVKIK